MSRAATLPPNVLPFRALDGLKYRAPLERWADTPHLALAVKADRGRVQLTFVTAGTLASTTLELSAAEAAGLAGEPLNAACCAHQQLQPPEGA